MVTSPKGLGPEKDYAVFDPASTRVSYNRPPDGIEDTTSNPSISCFPMQLPLANSLPRNSTVKASISVVTTYYVRVSDAAVVRVFVSAETETSSNSFTIEVCVLVVDVA
jgi:hypothetical protein